MGCHFLLQCMKVKSEREDAQLYLTLHDPMDCNPPDSSIHGIFQARVLEWGAIAFSVKLLYGVSFPCFLSWSLPALICIPDAVHTSSCYCSILSPILATHHTSPLFKSRLTDMLSVMWVYYKAFPFFLHKDSL